MVGYEKHLYWLMGLCIAVFVVLGLASDGLGQALEGAARLQGHAARLINDYTVIGGTGGAFLNAAAMGLLALIMVRVSGIRLSGPTIAGIFTIMGFSLFGKTPLNAVPIMAGVFLAAKAAGKPLKNYLLIALFGTALGPLVSFVVFEAGLEGGLALAVGVMAGTMAGFLLPGLAMAMLRLHEGFNLYNIGLTSGFFGLFAAGVLAASGKDVTVRVIWNDVPSLPLTLAAPIIAILLVVWGAAADGGNLFRNLGRLFKQTGRLPSDFMESVSPGSALVNAGLLGLAACAYLLAVGADFNGPTIGGLMTLMGFATFGKHLKNCAPVVAGVFLATLVFGKSLTAPGPVLALLFGTTLAPLAGEFGPLVGLAAGFTHLVMVERTAAWHGGLDLYNNGFAGGLTAALFVAVIEWIRSNRNA